jgi:hypothetical protein
LARRILWHPMGWWSFVEFLRLRLIILDLVGHDLRDSGTKGRITQTAWIVDFWLLAGVGAVIESREPNGTVFGSVRWFAFPILLPSRWNLESGS